MWMISELDHVANRVGFCTLMGLGAGAAYATVKGLPLRSVTFSVATSCTLVSTSLFTIERLVNITLQQLLPLLLSSTSTSSTTSPTSTRTTSTSTTSTSTPSTTNTTTTTTTNNHQPLSVLLSSHAVAGIVGGGLNGYLYHYQIKPWRGIIVFFPFMMGVAGIEWTFIRAKQQKQIQQQIQQQQQQQQ
jgi:F0F1-type ATP synthase assembly protein I